MSATPQRNRREEIARQRALKERAERSNRRMAGARKFLLLLVLAGAAIAAYVHFGLKPKDARYAVMDKRMLTGDLIRTYFRTSLGRDDYRWKEPRFFLVCLGEQTRNHVVYEVSEFDYLGTPLRSIVTREEISDWNRISPETNAEDSIAIIDTIKQMHEAQTGAPAVGTVNASPTTR